MFYLAVEMEPGATLELPLEHAERGVYAVAGDIQVSGSPLPAQHLAVVPANTPVRITARSAARLMLLGGAALDGDRHIWWNFVASSRALIDEAAQRWSADAFPAVPGETERMPLPATREAHTTFVP